MVEGGKCYHLTGLNEFILADTTNYIFDKKGKT
jgi:hypothetical protein